MRGFGSEGLVSHIGDGGPEHLDAGILRDIDPAAHGAHLMIRITHFTNRQRGCQQTRSTVSPGGQTKVRSWHLRPNQELDFHRQNAPFMLE